MFKGQLIKYITGYNLMCVGVEIVICRINILHYVIVSNSEG